MKKCLHMVHENKCKTTNLNHIICMYMLHFPPNQFFKNVTFYINEHINDFLLYIGSMFGNLTTI